MAIKNAETGVKYKPHVPNSTNTGWRAVKNVYYSPDGLTWVKVYSNTPPP